MIVMLCVDDQNGLLFNHRRQSKDRAVLIDMLHECKEQSLYMEDYSYAMFQELSTPNMVIAEDFLGKAAKGDYCFVEKKKLMPYLDQIEQVILYKWNRRYPVDVRLDIDLSQGWRKVETREFKGFSHEKITKEVYSKI